MIMSINIIDNNWTSYIIMNSNSTGMKRGALCRNITGGIVSVWLLCLTNFFQFIMRNF